MQSLENHDPDEVARLRRRAAFPAEAIATWFAATSFKSPEPGVLADRFHDRVALCCTNLFDHHELDLGGSRTGLSPKQIQRALRDLAGLVRRMNEIAGQLRRDGLRSGAYNTKRDQDMRALYRCLFEPVFGPEIGGPQFSSSETGIRIGSDVTLELRLKQWADDIDDLRDSALVQGIMPDRRRPEYHRAHWVRQMGLIYKDAYDRNPSAAPPSEGGRPGPFVRFVSAAWAWLKTSPRSLSAPDAVKARLTPDMIRAALSDPGVLPLDPA